MSPKQKKASKHKHGIQHYFTVLAMLATFSYLIYTFILPGAVQTIVVDLFKPEAEELIHIDGVFALPSQEGKNLMQKGGEHTHHDSQGEQLKKYINSEYIFDFTTKVRVAPKEAKAGEQNDGYNKAANEWYVRAPKLGEEAIILEPMFAFSYVSLALGAAIAMLLSLVMPSKIGLMAAKVDREIEHTKDKIRLQTGLSMDIVEYLVMPNAKLESQDRDLTVKAFRRIWDRTEFEVEGHHHVRLSFNELMTDDADLTEFREEVLYIRIKEFFSDFVVKEIIDIRSAMDWSKNHLLFLRGLRLYMSHHFTEKYSNNVTGLAYAGAAILIVVIGIRGLKFIPSTRPSLILGSIFLEGSMLALLAFALVYTEEEERMDKMMKKMEDANRSQLDTLEDVSKDMHTVATALVDGSAKIVQMQVQQAVTEYLSNPNNLHGSVGDAVGKIVVDVLAQGVRKNDK